MSTVRRVPAHDTASDPASCYRLRREEPRDQAAIDAMYMDTRRPELEATDWDVMQREAFLTQQARAQRSHYREFYPGADFNVIEINGAIAGRLYLYASADDVRIMDIIIAPHWRRQGFGTRVLQDVIDSAAGNGQSVSIHVEKHNPALSLYRRLGFAEAEDAGVYWLMSRPVD